jgi:hypothetical protein
VPAPNVVSLSPEQGRAGDTVTVRGSGLPIGTTVQLVFGTGAAPVDATVTQTVDDELSFTVPVAPLVFTSGLVQVTSPTDESATADTPFHYATTP